MTDPNLCNGCGDCCDPLRIHIETLSTMLPWAGAPDPAEHPEAFPDTSLESERDVKLLQARIKNANFASRWWVSIGKQVWPIDSAGMVSITCPHYDQETRRCNTWETRPPICSGFPFYDMGPENCDRMLSPRCGYWEAIPVSKRPKGWRPPTEEEIRADRSH